LVPQWGNLFSGLLADFLYLNPVLVDGTQSLDLWVLCELGSLEKLQ
jgi:hypothetical protein